MFRAMLARMAGSFRLVGMLDSPFVRRVAVALEVYGMPYENLPLRTLGDAAEFARYSPLKRAPTLVLPDGAALVDSHMILAHLDELAPEERCLTPRDTAGRLLCRQVVGVAAGLADKSVSAFYERNFHAPEQRSARLLERNRGQLADSLAWLEERAPAQWLVGSKPCHADIMVGVGLRFAKDALPDMLDLAAVPRVAAWFARLEALPELCKTYLAFDAPK
jgi:glutathione S-transferase